MGDSPQQPDVVAVQWSHYENKFFMLITHHSQSVVSIKDNYWNGSGNSKTRSAPRS